MRHGSRIAYGAVMEDLMITRLVRSMLIGTLSLTATTLVAHANEPTGDEFAMLFEGAVREQP
jgi:hypothetical protein